MTSITFEYSFITYPYYFLSPLWHNFSNYVIEMNLSKCEFQNIGPVQWNIKKDF